MTKFIHILTKAFWRLNKGILEIVSLYKVLRMVKNSVLLPQLEALYGDSVEPLSIPLRSSSFPTSLSPTNRNFNKQSYGFGDPGPGDRGSVGNDMSPPYVCKSCVTVLTEKCSHKRNKNIPFTCQNREFNRYLRRSSRWHLKLLYSTVLQIN